MSQAGQTGPELGFSLKRGRVAGMPPVHKVPAIAAKRGTAAMTDRSHEIPQDDLRNLVRVVSACTLGLWAFAAGLLIGVFLFS
jgi:hypothetical protein